MTLGSLGASTEEITLQRLNGAIAAESGDVVAVEEPLEIRVEGKPVAVVMRTPGSDRELAAGFLLTEGIIKSARDLFDLTTCVAPGDAGAGNVIDAALSNPSTFDLEKLSRHVFTSSSCGICARSTIEAVIKRRKPLQDDVRVSSKVILRLPRRLSREQTAFKETGGIHACALFDTKGNLVAVREDVGRLNALD